MLSIIKAAIPTPIKKILTPIRQNIYIPWQKKRLFKSMQVKHAELLNEIKGKEKVKVLFLAIHESVWKVDPVFKRMLEDPFFQPEILVCPYTIHGEERMLEDMEQAYNYFIKKGYPVHKSKNEDGSWINLIEIAPDIVFFTNPHNLTRKEYYEDAYMNYLSCYVPYGHSVSKFNNYVTQYNQKFHNAMWLIFVPHKEALDIFKKHSATKGRNVLTTGYPGCEIFLEDIEESPWKNDDKYKVIWAPHHTISSSELPYGNFLKIAQDFVVLTEKFSSHIQFAFKPHPMLKSKLYLHPEWGMTKTDAYYNYWQTASNTQLELGDYAELFKHSSALIHDSGSFIAEYHYVKKPVLYIYNDQSKHHLNPYGVKAMEASYLGSNIANIEDFLNNLIEGNLKIDDNFFKRNIASYFEHGMPSEKIISVIKSRII